LNVPQGLYRVPRGNVLGLNPGPYTTVSGTSGRGANDFRPIDFTQDLFNYAPYNFLQTPSRRGAVWLQARHALTRSVELFAEGLAHHSESHQQVAPSTYSTLQNGAAPLDPTTGEQIVPANNYYNPFGVDIPRALRRMVEGGDRLFREVSEAERVLLGLRGNLGAWHWETSLVWARNRTESFETGVTLRTAAALAVGPSGPDAAGHIVCGTPDPATGIVPSDHIIDGCVPLNLFGGLGPDGSGTITPEQLSYINRNLHNRGVNEQRLADAILTGPFGRLSAGYISWAFGVQYREETGKLALDPLNSLGVSGSAGNSQRRPHSMHRKSLPKHVSLCLRICRRRVLSTQHSVRATPVSAPLELQRHTKGVFAGARSRTSRFEEGMQRCFARQPRSICMRPSQQRSLS
jgi:iron complex outermembrane receptor protein